MMLVLLLLGLQQCCSHQSAAVQLWRVLQVHVPSAAAHAAMASCWSVTQLPQREWIKLMRAHVAAGEWLTCRQVQTSPCMLRRSSHRDNHTGQSRGCSCRTWSTPCGTPCVLQATPWR